MECNQFIKHIGCLMYCCGMWGCVNLYHGECEDVWIYTKGNGRGDMILSHTEVRIYDFIPWGMWGRYMNLFLGKCEDVWTYHMENVWIYKEHITWVIWGDVVIYELIQWGCIKLSYEECEAYINLCHGDCGECRDTWTRSEEITFKLLLLIMTCFTFINL